jgi:hypothetical protein
MTNIILGVIDPSSLTTMTVEFKDGGFDISIDRLGPISPDQVDGTQLKENIINYKIFVDAKYTENKLDICSGFLTTNNEIKLICDSERMSSGDIDSVLASTLSIMNISRSQFSIGFGETGNFFVASIPLKSKPTGDVVFEEAAGRESIRDWISSKDEKLSSLIKTYRATRAGF